MGYLPKHRHDTGQCRLCPPAPAQESPIVSLADPKAERILWYGLLFAAVVFAVVAAVTG